MRYLNTLRNYNRKRNPYIYIVVCIGYSMKGTETITKRITTKEITEYIVRCANCGKRIIGSTEGQVAFNLTIHKQSKGCKNE